MNLNLEPMTCHERLSYFIKNFDSADQIDYSNEKYSDIIEKYLKVHEDQFNQQDLPNLVELGSKNPDMAKICDIAIAAINGKKETSLEEVRDVYNTMSIYLSVEDVINLCLIGKAPDDMVIKAIIANAAKNSPEDIENEDIQNFANCVFEKFINLDSDTSSAMIQVFFKHACPEAHTKFFATIHKLTEGIYDSRNDMYGHTLDKFFHHLIGSLPTNLIYLDLSELKHLLTDNDILQIKDRLNCLESLNLQYCDCLTDNAFALIAQSPNMARLRKLKSTKLTDVGITYLADSPYMASLESLSIRMCQDVTELGILKLASSSFITKLRELSLDYSHKVTDKGFALLANSPNMAHLEYLSVIACSWMTDTAVSNLANSPFITRLRELILDSSHVTGEAIAILAGSPNMAQLEILTTASLRGVTGVVLSKLAKSKFIKKLRKLVLYISDVNDDGISFLADSSNMLHLESLNLRFCSNITDKGISKLADSSFIRLKELDVGRCKYVNEEAALATVIKKPSKRKQMSGTASMRSG